MISPALCESLLRLLDRGPPPFTFALAPLVGIAGEGCLKPAAGLLELTEGEGEDCDDLTPLMGVWTRGGGRLILLLDGGGGAGFVAIAVAIVLLQWDFTYYPEQSRET